ncbi:MAG: STAS domain-containing protein [Spirochaetales bacterium]|nr:STAS domain-containing protein [Spirochaetales bacterium]
MKKKPTQKVVSPAGPLGIEAAAPLRRELLAAFEEADEVLFDFSRAEDVDLAVLQVLYAAKRSAAHRGAFFALIGSVAEKVSRRLQVAGFTRSACSTGEELETSLVDFGSVSR